MRRGQTLLELMVAIAILAVIAAVALRMVFAADRAMSGPEEQVTTAGGQAQLLDDLGRDLRSARGASGGSGRLTVRGERTVVYEWSRSGNATVRRVVGRPNMTREYPGVRVAATVRGRIVNVDIRGDAMALGTAFYMRN